MALSFLLQLSLSCPTRALSATSVSRDYVEQRCRADSELKASLLYKIPPVEDCGMDNMEHNSVSARGFLVWCSPSQQLLPHSSRLMPEHNCELLIDALTLRCRLIGLGTKDGMK